MAFRHLICPVFVLIPMNDVIESVRADVLRVPNDHGTIQSAIDAAGAGDTVLVAAGTWQERIQLKPGVTVKSAGDDSQGERGLQRAEVTIIDGSFDEAAGAGVTMAENSTLDGFTVTGVGRYDESLWQQHHATQGEEQPHAHIGAPGTAGIAVIGIERCTVTNNIVHHVGDTGIAIVGAEGKRVSPHIFRNVTFRNMGGGIGSMSGSTAIIEENVCFENFFAGIGHSHASPLVINNICYGNIRAGIGISEGSCPVVRGNTCHHNRRAGIGIRDEHTQPIVEHNECFVNDMAGIGIRDEARPVVRHNHCHRNRMAGIGSRDGSRALIEFNDCSENEMAGIGSRLGAAPVIRNNRCWQNRMSGIAAREGARPVIEDNDCFDNHMDGIGSQQDAAAIVRNNRCARNHMAGIGSRLGARPVIVDNECFENRMAGIGSREGAAPVICSNSSHHNGMAGIGSESGARPLIVDNDSRENRLAGIGVHDRESVAVIVGNRCMENRTVAVGLPDGATAFIHGNELRRTDGGAPPIVAIRGGANAVISGNLIQEGGVAGILVSGTALITGNQFSGRGPAGQGSAVWVPSGGAFDFESTVLASHNRCVGYRNLLNASRSSITATDNRVRDFTGPALIVRKPSAAARLFGNTAISDDPQDRVLDVDGLDHSAADNVLTNTDDAGAAAFPSWPPAPVRSDGDAFHPLINSGRRRTVQDGPWKLVVTAGPTIEYALYNIDNDPEETTDLSVRLEQITFRLRGMLEQQEAREHEADRPAAAPGN